MPEANWLEAAKKLLKGRTIVNVRYMASDEAEDIDWSSRPLVLELDDGTAIYPMRDDEGNDGGALGTTNKDVQTLPVMWL